MVLTRRDFLTTLLGAPLAFEACRRSPPAARYDGSLVGASVDVGHRLRDGLRIEPAADAWRDVDVLIVGGGIAGLSAAWRLERADLKDFVVLELEPRAGGTSSSGRNQVSAYPWGAHYLPVPSAENRALLRLLTEMGLAQGMDGNGRLIVGEEHLVRSPEERTFYKGQWWEGQYLRAGASAEDLRQLAAFQREVATWVGWRDARGRRAFAIPVSRCSDDAEVTALDRITLQEWLDRRGLRSSRLRWLVNYACRDDYGTTLQTTSAWAGLFYFASRVDQQGEESADLMTWPEGNGRLAGWLRDLAGSRVRTNAAVTAIVPGITSTSALSGPTGGGSRTAATTATVGAADGGTSGPSTIASPAPSGSGTSSETTRIEVRVLDTSSQRPLGFRARRVIFAAPPFLAPYLVRGLGEDRPSIRQLEHSPWVVANLTLTERPVQVGFPPAWDNVLYESPSLGYVVATHQSLHDYGPTVWTWYYPLVGADVKAERRRLLEGGWDEWADAAVADLSRAHPDLEQYLSRIDVMRWGHAMIRPTPGTLWGGARQKAAEPFRGVHFAHTDLSGIPLFEEAFDHGVRAAEEVLEALRSGFERFR